MMMRLWTFCLAIIISVFVLSCASWRQVRADEAAVAVLNHRHGSPSACLLTCVDMVLDYYGYAVHFAQRPGLNYPANLLVVDSLLHTLSSQQADAAYKLHSFVLQEDEPFLHEQLARSRPVILIFQVRPNQFHSIVLAGVSADQRHFFIHDPARGNGQWISRIKLLKRWQSSGNTALLIGLAPAGT